MSDLVEYVDRNGDRWAFMAGDHTWLESPAHGGRRCAVWYVLREYGPLVPAGFLADMEGATQDLGEAAEEIERLRAEVASLRQQLDEARTERDHWKGLADEAPEPCPLDHGCEPEEVCSCWCMLHDCALDECPTLKTVEAWLEQLRQEGQRLVRKVRTECDVAEADNARLLDVYRAAEAWRDSPNGAGSWAEGRNLVEAVDSYRAGTPAEALPVVAAPLISAEDPAIPQPHEDLYGSVTCHGCGQTHQRTERGDVALHAHPDGGWCGQQASTEPAEAPDGERA